MILFIHLIDNAYCVPGMAALAGKKSVNTFQIPVTPMLGMNMVFF